MNKNHFLFHIVKSNCQKVEISTTPYKTDNRYQQNGKLSFKNPEKTKKWIINVTFSNVITKIVVHGGINENCIGNMCTFKNLNWNGAQEKDAKILLTYQIDFETKSTPYVIRVTFNEHDICSVGEHETGTTTVHSIVGKFLVIHMKIHTILATKV